MDPTAYLRRIGVEDIKAPDLDNLELLQRAHMTQVPFENLDVFYRRGVRTDINWSVPKIVERGRGGWCFELNGSFSELLRQLGYDVKLQQASVLYEPVDPMPSHLTLEVTLDRPYLVDVGFGDSFIKPLPLDDPGPHDGGTEPYWFEIDDAMYTLMTKDDDGSWKRHYRFSRDDVTLEQLTTASDFLQTSPDRQWIKSRFATRLLDNGPDRVTLLEDRLKVRREGAWQETPITEEQFPLLLQQMFGMEP